ncbi:MAG: hypothetical protein A2545_04230 [Planctomycetes bacterium RIFOXYD2_FULL_41_16]|nr:MAG: hypothetical protein A2069_03385 [Planctomycetes bacterium GWB2_41_19]OHB47023.1 MAG: hypothetical protein A2094_03050 [Planctomycetes bacterium GWE2_41_14]OHB73619.1 MAG: hypothetical protein A2W17_10020 [Planctomycetes bacterium RBG_16_41_13]OHC06532.1 MAG: hypothetical protein A3J92_01620 [Planctomycetes bacterium RIFOXYC2_FULL_41_27]OHC06994.1 MAG: hypothetical protein A3K50_07675 [Planctomycetes bacterium RIFOXYD12_FULL_42_12]OHC07769.1 MAG: hypothetical protein A2545_04230 [Planc
MAKRINKKKIVGVCPAGIQKTKCPSIKTTRQLRVRLLAVQRENNVNTDQVVQLRTALKERKIRGITVDCGTCCYNTSASTATPVSQ